MAIFDWLDKVPRETMGRVGFLIWSLQRILWLATCLVFFLLSPLLTLFLLLRWWDRRRRGK